MDLQDQQHPHFGMSWATVLPVGHFQKEHTAIFRQLGAQDGVEVAHEDVLVCGAHTTEHGHQILVNVQVWSRHCATVSPLGSHGPLTPAVLLIALRENATQSSVGKLKMRV